jgi:NAD-dependent deacetylase
MYSELSAGFDMVFSIGTSSVFRYISWPVEVAKQGGIPTVEINPGTSDVSHLVDIQLALPAAKTLDEIWERFQTASQ